MAVEFDPSVFFRTLPSFYRERMPDADRAVLATLWEGLARLVDAEYAEIFDTLAAPKLSTVRPLSRRARRYVRLEDDAWRSLGTDHAHVVVRKPGTDDAVFYLGRRLRRDSLRVYWDGLPVLIAAPSFCTDEPDAAQRAGTAPAGTRIEFRRFDGATIVPDTTYADPDKLLTVESDYETGFARLTGDGSTTVLPFYRLDETDAAQPAEIDPAAAELFLRRRYAANLAFADDGDGSAVVWPDGFTVGQTVRLERQSGALHRQVVAAAALSDVSRRLAWSEDLGDLSADPVTAVSIEIDWRWSAPRIARDEIVFATPVPPGLRLRVEDAAGPQQLTAERRAQTTFRLPRGVDPLRTRVYCLNVDLAAVGIAADGVDFGRPPAGGVVWEATAPFAAGHDHARHAVVLPVDADVVRLPADRPLALRPDFTEDYRYPVVVCADGRRLDPADYVFDSTTAIRFTGGELPFGTRVDVLYVDGETQDRHRHLRLVTTVPAGASLASVALPEAADARYPATIETDSGGLAAAASTLLGDALVASAPPLAGASFALVGAALPSFAWETLLPPLPTADGGAARIVAAARLRDGIDDADVDLGPDEFELTETDDGVRLRAAAKLLDAWFVDCDADRSTLAEVLGEPAGYVAATSERYRRVLTAFYAAMYGPSTVYALENFACVAFGADYARKAGTLRGVRRAADGSRTVEVAHADGTTSSIAADAAFELRLPATPAVPPFHAPERRVRLFHGAALADLPYVAYFAEAFSPDFRVASRLDVWEDYDYASVDPQYDAVERLLTDAGADFPAAGVRAGTLLRVTLGPLARVVHVRVEEVVRPDALRVTVELLRAADLADSGWGEPDGWGETVGWGGVVDDERVTAFVAYGRVPRRVDSPPALDEAPSEPLVDGEDFEALNAALAALYAPFLLVLRADWNAALDAREAVEALRLIEAVKPADAACAAFVRVQDDAGVQDSMAAVGYDALDVQEIPRLSFVGQDFVGSFYIAASTTILPPDDATPDPAWFVGSGSIGSAEVGGETAYQSARYVTVI